MFICALHLKSVESKLIIVGLVQFTKLVNPTFFSLFKCDLIKFPLQSPSTKTSSFRLASQTHCAD